MYPVYIPPNITTKLLSLPQHRLHLHVLSFFLLFFFCTITYFINNTNYFNIINITSLLPSSSSRSSTQHTFFNINTTTKPQYLQTTIINTIQYNTIQYNTKLYYTILTNIIIINTTHFLQHQHHNKNTIHTNNIINTIQYNTILYLQTSSSSTQHTFFSINTTTKPQYLQTSSTQYLQTTSLTQYNTIQYNTIQYYTILATSSSSPSSQH